MAHNVYRKAATELSRKPRVLEVDTQRGRGVERTSLHEVDPTMGLHHAVFNRVVECLMFQCAQ